MGQDWQACEAQVAFFGLGTQDLSPLQLRGDRVLLRCARIQDFEQWAQLRRKSQVFLAPWEPLWSSDDLTSAAFRRRVRRNNLEMENEEAFAFLIFRQTDNCLVGGITLGHIRRGVAQAATLGYWMGQPFAGQGYMSRAVRTALEYAFGSLHLHRVEAACLPHNTASIHLLEATGFQREGLARQYLQIAGKWQDHLLFGCIAGDDR